MNPERIKYTSDELDKFAKAFHVASRIHGEHVQEFGEEAGDLVTIEEYDRALREVGLGVVVDRRREQMRIESESSVASEHECVTA